MKKSLKLLVALAAFALVPGIVSCGQTSGDNPQSINSLDNQKLDAAIESLTVPSEVTASFTLKVSAAGGVTVSWESNNTDVIAISGGSATVNRQDSDVTVKLTATAKVGEATKKKEFSVKVVKFEAVETITVKQAFEADLETSVSVKGVVTEFVWINGSEGNYKSGFYITDATGTLFVYGPAAAATLNKGDEIVFSAKRSEKTGGKFAAQQLAFPENVRVLGNNKKADFSSAITGKTVQNLIDEGKESNLSGYTYKLNAKFEIYAPEGKNFKIYEILDPTTNKYISLYTGVQGDYKTAFGWLDQYIGQTKDVIFNVNSYNSSGYLRGTVLAVL